MQIKAGGPGFLAGVALAVLLPGASPAGDRPVPAPERTLLLPLDVKPVLTSSFGEYRSGHYHGGLDFSTGGREGLPVIAPAAGWVFRLRSSGIGYGRSVYFRLDDGRTVILAHLSRFHPRIHEALRAAQIRLGRYEVDIHPRPGSLSFASGDTLGYSGQSGAGPPHLHAEIRIGEDAAVAVNPLGQGWWVADPVPPVLSRVRLEPAAPGARLRGGLEAVVLELDPASPETLSVSGPFRIWVEASDRGAAPDYRLAPHAVSCRVDGTPRVTVAFDRFHWNWAREVEWTFHNALAREKRERWLSLQPPPRGRQGVIREEAGGSWSGALSPGMHTVRFEASDLGGNRTGAGLVLEVVEAASGPLPVPVRIPGVRSRGAYLEVRVASGEPVTVEGIAPDGTPVAPAWTRLEAPGGWVYQCAAPQPPLEGIWSFTASGGGGDTLLGHAVWLGGRGGEEVVAFSGHGDAGGGLQMELSGEATYGPMWIDIQVDAVPPLPGRPGLEPVMGVVHLGPWAAPLRERIRVALDPPRSVSSRRGLALHSWDGRGWTFEGADTSGEGVAGTLRCLERLTLFRDRTAPAIVIDGRAAEGVLAAGIEDEGVGVIWPDITMRLNGEPVIAEWDPEAGRLTGYPEGPPGPGEYTLEVTASDRVGNRSTEIRRFSIP